MPCGRHGGHRPCWNFSPLGCGCIGSRSPGCVAGLRPIADLVRHRDPFGGVRSEIRRHAVSRANLSAFQRYRLRPYSGSVVLFYAEGRPLTGELDGRLRWHRLADTLEAYGVPAGDSGQLLAEPQVRVLAAQLAACMRRLAPRPRT